MGRLFWGLLEAAGIALLGGRKRYYYRGRYNRPIPRPRRRKWYEAPATPRRETYR